MVPKSERGFKKLKMKHQKGGGCFSWFPKVGWEESKASKRGYGSQEWGGKGVGRHEKRFGCFMVPKRGVGRV